MVLPFVKATTRQEWSGWENLPTEGGFVAAPNHISYFDPFSVSHFLYASGCEPYFLGKEEVFRVPVFGRLLVASGQVPVYRKTGRGGGRIPGRRGGGRATASASSCSPRAP